mmetsp:Transcript_15920/g.44619  ORF Transcript_15920/g.44619 Transcript_15920/m.44619 type:complete len:215 (+) Transcript_15920:964-1608(+)
MDCVGGVVSLPSAASRMAFTCWWKLMEVPRRRCTSTMMPWLYLLRPRCSRMRKLTPSVVLHVTLALSSSYEASMDRSRSTSLTRSATMAGVLCGTKAAVFSSSYISGSAGTVCSFHTKTCGCAGACICIAGAFMGAVLICGAKPVGICMLLVPPGSWNGICIAPKLGATMLGAGAPRPPTRRVTSSMSSSIIFLMVGTGFLPPFLPLLPLLLLL